MNKKTNTKSNLAVMVLLTAVLIAISSAGGFYFGIQIGKKQGAQAAVTQVTDLLNPLKAVSNNPAFPYTSIGKVVSVNNSAMKLRLADGTEKEILLDEKTNVSKGSKALTLEDIKVDSNVTAFTAGKGKNQLAVRVILR